MPPRKTSEQSPDIIPAPTPPAMELVVLEKSLAFRWNFIEVKAALAETIKKYHGLVVTDDNLPDMEKTQKEIAGLRIKLDTFRKETKKQLSEPADLFDSQVKELQGEIEKAEKPIVEQIQKFEDARVLRRTNELTEVAQKMAVILGLRDEYFKYEVPAKLTNRSISEIAVRKEIEAALQEMLARQGAEDAAKEEELRQQGIRAELDRQRDGLIVILADTHSKAFGLRTPVTLMDIRRILTPEIELAAIPDIIVNECKKRQQIETTATVPPPPGLPPSPIQPEEAAFVCIRDLPPAVTSPPQRRADYMPTPPPAPPWAGPPATVQRYDLTLKFPAISAVNIGALAMWLDRGKIEFITISKVPVKGE